MKLIVLSLWAIHWHGVETTCCEYLPVRQVRIWCRHQRGEHERGETGVARKRRKILNLEESVEFWKAMWTVGISEVSYCWSFVGLSTGSSLLTWHGTHVSDNIYRTSGKTEDLMLYTGLCLRIDTHFNSIQSILSRYLFDTHPSFVLVVSRRRSPTCVCRRFHSLSASSSLYHSACYWHSLSVA